MNTLYHLQILTEIGPRTAMVIAFDGPDMKVGMCAFLQPDAMGGVDDVLGVARTLGVENGVVRLGPASVFSPHDVDTLVFLEDTNVVLPRSSLRSGVNAPATISISMVVTLLTMSSATTILPHPFAFEGDDVARDPKTGEPLRTNATA